MQFSSIILVEPSQCIIILLSMTLTLLWTIKESLKYTERKLVVSRIDKIQLMNNLMNQLFPRAILKICLNR